MSVKPQAIAPVPSWNEKAPVELGASGSETVIVRAPVPILMVAATVLVLAIVMMRGAAPSVSLTEPLESVTPSNTQAIWGVSPLQRTLSEKGSIHVEPLAVAVPTVAQATVTHESAFAVTPESVAKESLYASAYPLALRSAVTA